MVWCIRHHGRSRFKEISTEYMQEKAHPFAVKMVTFVEVKFGRRDIKYECLEDDGVYETLVVAEFR